MRAVLRVEVEAVKFLKEEPHKLDSMLKRVKSLTDTLSNLRRCVEKGAGLTPYRMWSLCLVLLASWYSAHRRSLYVDKGACHAAVHTFTICAKLMSELIGWWSQRLISICTTVNP